MSAFESRETIPGVTLTGIVGPAKRHEIAWYSLKKLPEAGEHKGRSVTWLAIYGKDAARGEKCKRLDEVSERRGALRVVEG